jgi:predicted dinucleotide-binding enzyme
MGLRAVDVGALTNAGPLEGITAVLATINRPLQAQELRHQDHGPPG